MQLTTEDLTLGLVLVALGCGGSVLAADVGANMGFETAVEDGAGPAGWFLGEGGWDVALDAQAAYAGGHSLRIRSGDEVAEENGVVSQRLNPRFAAGKRLRLFGFIKTADLVDGEARLWLRVDRGDERMALVNMDGRGASGTTHWTEFRIEVPVDPNATRILFGVMVDGKGTAWFDRLRFAVAEDSVVDAAPWPELPPRPVYTAELLSDDALALTPADDEPEEDAASAAWVIAQHRPIRSLVSEDYSDLAFLKPLLRGKRIVQIGENGHGVAEFNHVKSRLVKYLHGELGFEVIAFESSIWECHETDRRAADQDAIATMRGCVFSIWHTAEVEPLFEYLRESKTTRRPLHLAGIDIQASSESIAATRPEQFARIVGTVDADYAVTVRQLDEDYRAGSAGEQKTVEDFLAANGKRFADGYASLAAWLVEHERELIAAGVAVDDVRVARRAAWSLGQHVAMLTADNGLDRTIVRDRAMADNLDFLLEQLYPGKKIIVWAHNFHVRHANDAVDPNPVRSTGSWLAERHRKQLYTIGLYQYRGNAAWNDRSPFSIDPAPVGSLESILHQAGRRYVYVDLSKAKRTAGTTWMDTPIVARLFGKNDVKMVVRDQYDAVLLIDTTWPPDYLPGQP